MRVIGVLVAWQKPDLPRRKAGTTIYPPSRMMGFGLLSPENFLLLTNFITSRPPAWLW